MFSVLLRLEHFFAFAVCIEMREKMRRVKIVDGEKINFHRSSKTDDFSRPIIVTERQFIVNFQLLLSLDDNR